MVPCLTLRKCDVVTYHRHRDTTISIGVATHDGIKYVTVCFRDPLLGCQHLSSRQALTLILIEKLARAVRLSGE